MDLFQPSKSGAICQTCRWFRPLFKGSTVERPAFGGMCVGNDGEEAQKVQPGDSCGLHEVSVKYA